MVYPALLPMMRTPLLPVVDWTDAPADLKGLVRFAERRNLVSARVPTHFKRSLPTFPSIALSSSKSLLSSETSLYLRIRRNITESTESGTECSCLRVMQESLRNHMHVEHRVGCLVKGLSFWTQFWTRHSRGHGVRRGGNLAPLKGLGRGL
jgi:hypothetical protein